MSRNNGVRMEDFDISYLDKWRIDLNRYVNISLKNKYIYFSASKCASGTIKAYLQEKELEGSHWDIKTVDDKRYSPHLSPYQLGDDLFLQILHDREFKKVCFVRDPYFRVLACYLYRVLGAPKSVTSRSFKRATGVSVTPDLTFVKFLRAIEHLQPEDMEYHFKPLSKHLHSDVVGYDFIGRVERLGEGLNEMAALLYGSDTRTRLNKLPKDYVHPVANSVFEFPGAGEVRSDKYNIKGKTDKEIFDIYYDEEALALASCIYSQDIEKYGYAYSLGCSLNFENKGQEQDVELDFSLPEEQGKDRG